LKNDILDHIADVHELQSHTDTYLQALSVEIQHDPPEQLSCSLCHDTLSSHRKWHKHVAHHLEQLALFVIPRDNLEGKDKEESESDNDQDKQDQQSITSTGRDSDKRASEGLEKQILDDEDADIMADVARQSLIYSNSGRYEEAEELQKQVIDSRKHVLGQDHPSTLEAMAELASMYKRHRRYMEAEELLIQVLRQRKIVLGEDHLSTIRTERRLVEIYIYQKRFKEAEELQRQIGERCVAILGEDSYKTMILSAGMASIYGGQGRYNEAEEARRRAGEEYKEVEELQRQMVESYKAVLGENDPHTLIHMNDLARILEPQGRISEAMDLMEQVVQRSEEVFCVEDQFRTSCIRRLNKWRAKHAEAI
jgi:tetratricopeptide (TPR) repeat protein